jgi:hypothetical protein
MGYRPSAGWKPEQGLIMDLKYIFIPACASRLRLREFSGGRE